MAGRHSLRGRGQEVHRCFRPCYVVHASTSASHPTPPPVAPPSPPRTPHKKKTYLGSLCSGCPAARHRRQSWVLPVLPHHDLTPTQEGVAELADGVEGIAGGLKLDDAAALAATLAVLHACGGGKVGMGCPQHAFKCGGTSTYLPFTPLPAAPPPPLRFRTPTCPSKHACPHNPWSMPPSPP